MKQFLVLLVIVFFAACNNAAKTDEAAVTDSASNKVKTDSLPNYIHSFTDTALENKITDALMKTKQMFRYRLVTMGENASKPTTAFL
jgi:PhoPQ-activated pathogenicity-related protein